MVSCIVVHFPSHCLFLQVDNHRYHLTLCKSLPLILFGFLWVPTIPIVLVINAIFIVLQKVFFLKLPVCDTDGHIFTHFVYFYAEFVDFDDLGAADQNSPILCSDYVVIECEPVVVVAFGVYPIFRRHLSVMLILADWFLTALYQCL